MTGTTTSHAATMLMAALAATVSFHADVTPTYSRAPAVVRVTAYIEPDPANGYMQVVLDSGSYYRSSTIELSGARASRIQSFQFTGIPVGAYDLRVALLDARGGVRAVVPYTVTVVE